ncbi:hypothetical protein [Sphingosinicella sp. BN140058]|uniref:hypothetical protein n=1 Tax=Sphingosinicella sp. BN140058 TaxID=1892855 RepID=UPI001012D351|nr:hypothetical protein [Sphingosinicella sp. BN140058]QAY80461.1 hypothetical protein ETR14_27880 [Sphingosinicella sp. BN140058]
MEARAAADADYSAALLHYILDGSTLELRELARPFDDPMRSPFFNVVCSIDSAHLHFRLGRTQARSA